MRLLSFVAAGAALAASPAYAEGFAAGAGVGTAGLELHGSYRANDVISLRGTLSYLDFDVDGVDGEDVTYDAELGASTVGAFIDVRPFKNAFTLTAGAYFGDRKIDLVATPTRSVEVGDQTYTPAEIGTLSGNLSLGEVAPYLGVAYDTTFAKLGPGWGFRAALGVAIGEPDARLKSSTGLISQSDLDAEAQTVEDEADALKLYPVLSVGGTYRY